MPTPDEPRGGQPQVVPEGGPPAPRADSAYPLSLRATRSSLRRLASMPDRALRLLAGRQRTVDGQTLLPEAGLALRFLEGAPGEPIERLPVDLAREELATEAWLFAADTHIGEVRDVTVPGAEGDLPARHYDPTPGRTPRGVLVWFHSGGHVLGDLETNDSTCRLLARSSGMVVLSVHCRRAPEHPFPADVEDAIQATQHVVSRIGDLVAAQVPVLVGGESSGGGVAAVVAQHVQGLAGQLLLAPWLDLAHERPSYDLFGRGYLLDREQLAWYRAHYLLDPTEAKDPMASPIRAPFVAGLPPAVVVALGFDPLRDEALEYAQRLQDAGVPTTVLFEPGLTHLAANATGISRRARTLVDEAGAAVRAILDPPRP